jgi:hypothetical protein
MGMLLCMFAVAGLAYLYLNKGEPVDEATKAATQVEAQEADEPEAEAAPEAKPKPKRRSTRKAAPKRRTTSATKKTPPPASPAGEFEVTFISMAAKATISCGDGQSGSFVGRTRRKFTGVTTCRVDIGDAKGAVQVRRAGTMTCSVVESDVRCVGS